MENIRKQLTLFINESTGNIEKIREQFNPQQFNLISAHVTLCREDEIEPIERTIARIKSLKIDRPIVIEFDKVKRSEDGKGVFITGLGENKAFEDLRKKVLGQTDLNKKHVPHITLMHPRNSSCTDDDFKKIKTFDLPTALEFRKINLIEQKNGGVWKVLQEFDMV